MAEVLVDDAAALGGYGDEDLRVPARRGRLFQGGRASLPGRLPARLDHRLEGLPFSRVIGNIHRVDLGQGELPAAVVPQEAHGVGPALAAMPHHVHLPPAPVLQGLECRGRRPPPAREPVVRPVLGRGDEGHDVMEEGPERLDGLVHFHEVFVVDALDHDRVDFDQNPLGRKPLQTLQLPLREDPARVFPPPPLPLEVNPGIDPLSHFGIDHVYGDGDVVHVEFLDPVDVIGEDQAVGGQTELHVRHGLTDQFERPEGPLGARQGVARPRDSHHGHLGNAGGDGEDLLHRLFRRELLAHDARPALVGAVVLAVAVVALDVAGRRHGHVHPRVEVVGLLAVAGMILHLVPDRRRQFRRRGL